MLDTKGPTESARLTEGALCNGGDGETAKEILGFRVGTLDAVGKLINAEGLAEFEKDIEVLTPTLGEFSVTLSTGEGKDDGAEELDTLGWPGTDGKVMLGNTPCPGTIGSSVTISVDDDGRIDTSVLADCFSVEPGLETDGSMKLDAVAVLLDSAGNELIELGAVDTRCTSETEAATDGFTAGSFDCTGVTLGEGIPPSEGPNKSVLAIVGITFVALGSAGDTVGLMVNTSDGPAVADEARIDDCGEDTDGSKGVGVGKSTTASTDRAGESVGVSELNAMLVGPRVGSASGELVASTLAAADRDAPGSTGLDAATELTITVEIGTETDKLGNCTEFDIFGEATVNGIGVTVTETVGLFEIGTPPDDTDIEAATLPGKEAVADSKNVGPTECTADPLTLVGGIGEDDDNNALVDA